MWLKRATETGAGHLHLHVLWSHTERAALYFLHPSILAILLCFIPPPHTYKDRSPQAPGFQLSLFPFHPPACVAWQHIIGRQKTSPR